MESDLGNILHNDNVHPEANLLLSSTEFFPWLFFKEILGCQVLSFCCSTLDSEVAGDRTHGMLTPSASHQTPSKMTLNNGDDLIKSFNVVKKCFWSINYFSLNKKWADELINRSTP